jgi:asparagine synthase (glutamine-hydrolysing)
MCGISGIISRKSIVSIDIIKAMNDLINHRGPDGEGFYCNDNFNFGHRRLSIIDLSILGKQPMIYRENVITYNGEVYNYLELKEELLTHGYEFKSTTDTEVILAAYDFWGVECVHKFNGMWAFAIFDKKNDKIFMSRDRFGVKPFYYTVINDSFYFGSEIKQFKAIPEYKFKMNLDRTYDFLCYGVRNHTPETLFADVFQLKGGHNLIYNLKTFEYNVVEWYNPVLSTKNNKLNFDSTSEFVKKLFFDSVSLQLRSDVKVGSCLSGGIDSSSIVCTVNELLKSKDLAEKQETVSACFNDSEFSEEKYIDIVTDHTNTISHKITPSFPNLFLELEKIIWHQDEPFTSTSIFAQWEVFKEASKQNLKVMLDGQGADEYLSGYDNFYGNLLADYFKGARFCRFFEEIKCIYKNYGLFKLINFIFWFFSVILNNFSFLPEKLKLFLKHKVSFKNLGWLKLRPNKIVYDIYKVANMSMFDMNITQLRSITTPTLLQFEDRNSMAFSIESRVPFLDYRLVEYCIQLPNDYKISKSVTKYIFRDAMKFVLPLMISSRKDKVGFTTPQEKWIKSNHIFLREEISKSCDTLNAIIDKDLYLAWFDKSIKNNYNFNYNFWNIICLARWVKVFAVEITLISKFK